MSTLCVRVRERWQAPRVSPDRVLAVLLLVLLLVVVGRQWPALLHGLPSGAGVQQVSLDEDYVFED